MCRQAEERGRAERLLDMEPEDLELDELLRDVATGDHPAAQEAIQRLDARADDVDALLADVETLAQRLDVDAVLGLSEWALRNERHPELLRLVRSAQSSLSPPRPLAASSRLLQRALAAARALGDREAEAWVEGQLAVAADALE